MKTWALIGDSQAVGMKPHLVELMLARGYRLVGSSVHVGWDTGRMFREGQLEAIGARMPSVVLVVLGGNDSPTDALAGKIGDVVSALRVLSHPRIVWVGPAHALERSIAERKAAVASIQSSIAPRLGVTWLDGRAMTADLPHAPDGVHFTQVGLRTWAERLAPYIASERSSGLGWGIGLGVAAGVLGLIVFVTRRAR